MKSSEQRKLSDALKNPPAYIKEALENEAPDEVPQEHPHKTLWGCSGTDIAPPKSRWPRKKQPARQGLWRVLCATKEESEARAAYPCDVWKWDGKPATPRLIADEMAAVRTMGDKGVAVEAFIDGKWVSVAIYPAGEPLPEELR